MTGSADKTDDAPLPEESHGHAVPPITPQEQIEAAESHVAKWLMHEPVMEIGLVFTGAGRPRARLWGALLHEWLEATFNLSDAGVAQVKLAWWGEALASASSESAHPLVNAFFQQIGDAVPPGQWRELAAAAEALNQLDSTPVDAAALLASRLPLGRAVAAVENSLWPNVPAVDPALVARSLVLWQWQHQRHDRPAQPSWLPLQLLARHELRMQAAYAEPGSDAVRKLHADLASQLTEVPVASGGSRFRRIRTALDGLALERLRHGADKPFPHSGFAVLWRSWRAAAGVAA